jgi:ankyrin repeat protein
MLCFCIVLQTAAYLGHVRIVELLLKVDDQDPNIVDHHGEHALGSAARSTSPRRDCVVRLLLNRPDIDVNRRNDLGRTALFFTPLGTAHI